MPVFACISCAENWFHIRSVPETFSLSFFFSLPLTAFGFELSQEWQSVSNCLVTTWGGPHYLMSPAWGGPVMCDIVTSDNKHQSQHCNNTQVSKSPIIQEIVIRLLVCTYWKLEIVTSVNKHQSKHWNTQSSWLVGRDGLMELISCCFYVSVLWVFRSIESCWVDELIPHLTQARPWHMSSEKWRLV